MAQVAEHLVGRTAELDAFDRALTGLEQGGSAAIEVIGEPGIGKTRLLAELAARADAQGGLVLSGSASELERDLPFCVFVDALDEYIRGLESRRLEALEEDVRAELATVFPSLSAFAGDREVALPHERYRSHRAVRELLELLATTQPLVLLLDDLHWADPASVELLSALIRRPPAAPVLVALAVRPRQLPGPLSAALERAHRMDDIQRFELRPLTEPEAQELLGETVASSLVNALFEESGGNPFYLEQLARTPDRGPRAGGARSGAAVSLAGVEVPSMVAAALTEELALLSPSARRVLEGAAVAGDPFEPELAAAAAEVPESTAVEALDELLALDLVRATDVPRRFRFRHPIVRRAVYETTPAAWRLGAHERSAHALGLRGATAAALATHVERSARRGDPAAVGVLRKAGEQAALRAPESAARWFKVALEVLPATAPATDRIELLLPRAAALAAIGEYPESYAALLESLAIVPKHEAALRTKLTASCAGLEHLLGRHDHARTRLLDALDELPEGDSPESVSFMIELAVDRYYASCYDAMEDWARRALVAAKHLDDMPRAAAAAAVVALACAVECAKERADADCSEAAALVDGLSDDELAGRPDAISYLAYAELLLERFPQTGKHADRAIALARATGQGEQLPLLVSTRAIVWLLHGGLTEARAVLDDAVEAARLSNSARGMAWVHLEPVRDRARSRGPRTRTCRCSRKRRPHARPRRVFRQSMGRRQPRRRTIGERGTRARTPRARTPIGRRGAVAHPRRVEGQSPRASDTLPSFARPHRRRETDGGARRELGCDGRVTLRLGNRATRRGGGRARCWEGGARRRVGAPFCARRRRRRRSDRSGTVTHARGAGTRTSRQARSGPGGAAARGRRVRPLRSVALPRRCGAWVACTWPSRPPSLAVRDTERDRSRVAHGTRVGGRPARGRRHDESRNRGRTVPQPEDGRDASPQHLPQARCQLTCSGRASRGACGDGTLGRAFDKLLTPPDSPYVTTMALGQDGCACRRRPCARPKALRS